MAIRSGLHLEKEVEPQAQPRALALFTDRETQRTAIDAHLTRLRSGLGDTEAGVLHFHGVGGVGKTTLRQKAVADFRAKLDGDMYDIDPFALAEVDLDADSVRPDTPIPHILGRLRTALNKAGVRTPLFDYLYLAWRQEEFPDQQIRLEKHGSTAGVVGGILDAAELVGNVAGAMGIGLPSTAVAKGFHTLLPKVGEWFHQTRARQRFDGQPEGWSQRERIERMAALLGLDLLSAIEHTPQMAICLAVDGFERVQSRQPLPDAQWALMSLVAEVLRCGDRLPPPDGKPLRGRIGFLLFGRERLRWAELYGRERIRIDWKTQIDDYAELLGLSEADARHFLLNEAAPWERARGGDAAAALIEAHTPDILRAAAENLPGQPPSYLPYYLDLAVDMIRDNAGSFTPDMLGDTPAELERRFLRSLDDKHLKALQALALALEFDRETFDLLLGSGGHAFVTGYTGPEFDWLVGDHWSFVTPIGDKPGFHSFHRHMQASLIASLTATAEDKARGREIVLALLDWQATRMHFAKPADYGPPQEAAYRSAVAMFRNHYEAGLLDAESMVERVNSFEGKFDSVQSAAVRSPFLQWVEIRAKAELGKEHPATIRACSRRGAFLARIGESKQAHALFADLLPTCEAVFGPDHWETLTVRHNIACLTDRPSDARDMLVAHLLDRQRVLGPDHRETLNIRNNIAACTGNAGDAAKALALFKQLLKDYRRVFGPDDPKTLLTRVNLAGWTGVAGNPGKARDLFIELEPDCRRIFGPDHPSTLNACSNIAHFTGKAGDPAAARDLCRALLDDQLRVLGPTHPFTLRTRGNLALFTGNAGAPENALALYRELLPDCPPDDPNTLITRFNIAGFMIEVGKHAQARDLLVELLPDATRVLGPNHPDTQDVQNLLNRLNRRLAPPSASRNSPCPCGSGLRYKHCHGKLA